MTTKTATKRERTTALRRPSRGNGIARYQALVDATEALLQTQNPDAVGLYQIAEQAEVPAPSVYHFFPTKEAAYQALAERYLEGLVRMHGEPIEAARIRTWMDLYAFDLRRAMDYYNARPAMLKILYGGYGGVGARQIDDVVTDQMARAGFARLNKIFHVPYLAHPEEKARIALGILDAVWTISVRRFGVITEAYYDEAFRACTAYRRLYLPEHLEPRELLIEATARDGTLHLPYEVGDT